jgi:protein-S-isoprenylcysteine O-methyltransferase Ste14
MRWGKGVALQCCREVNMAIFKIIYWLAIVGQIVIRFPWQKVWKGSAKTVQRVSQTERLILILLLVGGFVFPLIYSVTKWLSFADYTLPDWAGWLGVVVLAFSLLLFAWGHRDLKKYWSPSLELMEDHKLITSGIYATIRHPMYLSQLVLNFAQILLLQNWIAGPIGLICFIPFYLVRVKEEDKMMTEKFGDEYKSYVEKTGGLLPKV